MHMQEGSCNAVQGADDGGGPVGTAGGGGAVGTTGPAVAPAED